MRRVVLRFFAVLLYTRDRVLLVGVISLLSLFIVSSLLSIGLCALLQFVFVCCSWRVGCWLLIVRGSLFVNCCVLWIICGSLFDV